MSNSSSPTLQNSGGGTPVRRNDRNDIDNLKNARAIPTYPKAGEVLKVYAGYSDIVQILKSELTKHSKATIETYSSRVGKLRHYYAAYLEQNLKTELDQRSRQNYINDEELYAAARGMPVVERSLIGNHEWILNEQGVWAVIEAYWSSPHTMKTTAESVRSFALCLYEKNSRSAQTKELSEKYKHAADFYGKRCADIGDILTAKSVTQSKSEREEGKLFDWDRIRRNINIYLATLGITLASLQENADQMMTNLYEKRYQRDGNGFKIRNLTLDELEAFFADFNDDGDNYMPQALSPRKIQRLVILLLYTVKPPSRCDYFDLVIHDGKFDDPNCKTNDGIFKISEDDKKLVNYIKFIPEKEKFVMVFNRYKTVKSYGQRRETITKSDDPVLYQAMRILYYGRLTLLEVYGGNRYVFVHDKDEKFKTSSSFGQWVGNVFRSAIIDGTAAEMLTRAPNNQLSVEDEVELKILKQKAHISPSYLRKIYLTKFFSQETPSLEERQVVAQSMGHSINMQEKYRRLDGAAPTESVLSRAQRELLEALTPATQTIKVLKKDKKKERRKKKVRL